MFAGVPTVGGTVCAGVFDRGLCLPSGSALAEAEIDRVVETVLAVPEMIPNDVLANQFRERMKVRLTICLGLVCSKTPIAM